MQTDHPPVVADLIEDQCRGRACEYHRGHAGPHQPIVEQWPIIELEGGRWFASVTEPNHGLTHLHDQAHPDGTPGWPRHHHHGANCRAPVVTLYPVDLFDQPVYDANPAGFTFEGRNYSRDEAAEEGWWAHRRPPGR